MSDSRFDGRRGGETLDALKRLVRRVLGAVAARCDADNRGALLRRLPSGTVGVEIGVYKGDFSARILRTARPLRLHLVDPWRYEASETYARSWYGGEAGGSQRRMDELFASVRRRFRQQIEAGTVVVHRASSREAAEGFADDYFDWVYIDGNHEYEFVREDLMIYGRKLRAGGYLAGDDYGMPGWWKDGVTRAVDEASGRGVFGTVEILGTQFLLRKLQPTR